MTSSPPNMPSSRSIVETSQDHIRAFSEPTSFIHGVDDECEGRSRLEGRCKSEEGGVSGKAACKGDIGPEQSYYIE